MNNIFITLVNPSHPGNIGAVARAMKNMSLQSLHLVKPQRAVNEEAFARATGADDLLRKAKYFEHLSDAIKDCQIVVGTSARTAVPDVSNVPVRTAASLIHTAAIAGQKVAILFGREHAGLTNEELALCHYHAYIPCNPDFSSLNLAAAAQIMCYELFLFANEASVGCAEISETAAEQAVISMKKNDLSKYASQAEVEQLFAHARHTLEDLHFYNPGNPRRLFAKLRALFNRTHLLQSEVAILRGILSAADACEKPVF